jgi:predicted esterase
MQTPFSLITAIALPLVARESGKPRPERFKVEDHVAAVYNAACPVDGRPRLWYAPALKGGLSPAGRKLYFDAFMRTGIGVAGFDQREVRGAPGSAAEFTRLHDEMVERRSSPRPILPGRGRGGLMALAWAYRHPDEIKACVGIDPVCNLARRPLKNSKKETLADFALTEDEIGARLDEFNPIVNPAGLAREKVPIFAIHGDSDIVVPHDANTRPPKEPVEALGGSCTVRIIPGEGREETASFLEQPDLIDFVIEHADQSSITVSCSTLPPRGCLSHPPSHRSRISPIGENPSSDSGESRTTRNPPAQKTP